MIRLHYSNRLEHLIEPLANSIHEQQESEPLRRVVIVVPNRTVEELLKLRLAETEGVAANLEFPFLRRFLADAAKRAQPDLRVLDAPELQLAIFECLRNVLPSYGASELEAVRKYIEASSNDHRTRELRIFQLSGQLAWLFREYSIVRANVLQRWSNGARRGGPDAGSSGVEVWQRFIFNQLFAADRILKRDWTAANFEEAAAVRWMLLPDAFRAADEEKLREVLPRRLHIFGLGYAGLEFIRIFSQLGKLVEQLHIYSINPCREYWDDVRDRPQRLNIDFESSEDPFGIVSDDENIALRRWGRAGREYIRLLNELTDCDFDAHFAESAKGQSATLLHCVQQMILERAPAHDAEKIEPASDDESIQFVECPSARREVEIAANAIWSLMRRNDTAISAEHLRFHQIAIVFPDTAGPAYLPHIENVFAELHNIPVDFVQHPLSGESRTAEAIKLLIKLPLGRFTRDEVTRLLTHPAVIGEFTERDTSAWAEWCSSLGIYFGADEGAFGQSYVTGNLFNWDQALKRLSLGIFMAGEPSHESRAFEIGENRYLPYEIPQESISAAALMVKTARAVLCDAQEMASRQMPLEQWTKAITEMISTYVHPDDTEGEYVRDATIRAIEAIAPGGIRSDPVSYEVAAEVALARITDAEAERGTYTESGVVIGPLSLMRSLPFRVIFMMGLGEAGFPESEHRNPLDLRQARRMAGDVSPTERDRYEFLETLLAARDRLVISHVSRDAQTGDPIEASSVVRDLRFILQSLMGEANLARLTVRHPVSGFDRKYFKTQDSSSGPHLEIVDSTARANAQIESLRQDFEAKCGRESIGVSREKRLENLDTTGAPHVLRRKLKMIELPPSVSEGGEPSDLILPISALRRYLECPIQGAARYALGMFDDDEEGQGDDDEPLEPEFLISLALKRDSFWRSKGNLDALEREYKLGFERAMMRGTAPTGLFRDAITDRDIKSLKRILENLRDFGCDFKDWQRIAIGGADEFTDVNDTLEAVPLEVNVERPNGRKISKVVLRGSLCPVSPKLDTSVRLVASKNIYPHDFLEGVFTAIALMAAGEERPLTFKALAISMKGDEAKVEYRDYTPPSQKEAREYLTVLARDLLTQTNDYFMPIEAVAATFQRKKSVPEEIEQEIANVREMDFHSCRSDYGPVRNAREFRICSGAEAKQIIERRFLPIRAIFTPPEKAR